MKVTLENINSLDGSEISSFYDQYVRSIDCVVDRLKRVSSQYSKNSEGLVFDTLLCEIFLKIQQIENLPNCVKINDKVYLVGDDKNQTEDFGNLTELFDMTREIETNGVECNCFYISCNTSMFPQATDEEKTQVRDFLKL